MALSYRNTTMSRHVIIINTRGQLTLAAGRNETRRFKGRWTTIQYGIFDHIHKVYFCGASVAANLASSRRHWFDAVVTTSPACCALNNNIDPSLE